MPLRRIEEKDLELMLKWRNHPSIRESMFSQSVIELDQHQKWFQRESEKTTSVWLLYMDSAREPSGVVYFTDMDHKCNNAFWGFYVAPDTKPGTGTQMAAEALEYYFVEQEFHKLNAEVLDSNKSSHHFHQKLGFQVEGVFRDQYLGKYGYQNVTRYGLLDTQWADRGKIIEGK